MGDLVWPLSLCLDVPSPGSCVAGVGFLFIRLINLLIFPCGSGGAASFLPLPSPGASLLSTNMWHKYTQSNLVLGSWAMYICQPNFTIWLSLLSPRTGSVFSIAISLETQHIVFSFLINLPQWCSLTGLHVPSHQHLLITPWWSFLSWLLSNSYSSSCSQSRLFISIWLRSFLGFHRERFPSTIIQHSGFPLLVPYPVRGTGSLSLAFSHSSLFL